MEFLIYHIIGEGQISKDEMNNKTTPQYCKDVNVQMCENTKGRDLQGREP